MDVNYEEDERFRKDKDMELVELPRFKTIGYVKDGFGRGFNKPVFRFGDAYLITNPRVKRILDRVFERSIKGRI